MAGRPGSLIALIDGANLPGLLAGIDASGAKALCLFTGPTASRLRDVAPYLIRIGGDGLFAAGLPDGTFPGILVHTALSLNDLRTHFRRFMRVEAGGEVYFFRFWDPPAASAYFNALTGNADRGRWFFPRDGGRLQTIFVPDAGSNGFCAHHAGATLRQFPWRSRPFRLTEDEIAALRAIRPQDGVDQLVSVMSATFPQLAVQLGPVMFDGMVRRATLRSAGFGIRDRANIFRFVAWDLHAHGNFEDGDPGAELGRILLSELGETEKMQRLIARLASLAPANRPTGANA